MTRVLGSTFSDIDVGAASTEYQAAHPFPHAVFDGIIEPHALAAAVAAFPVVDGETWTHYVHVNERKHADSRFDGWPEPLQHLADCLMGAEFLRFLERLTGIENLLADPLLDGGGLHRSERGGYLNIHTDYSKHHVHSDWKRRVNVLLYLNDEWDESWGGHLELWTSDMSRCARRVAPDLNRMVVFTTTTTSFHGHPTPLSCPQGEARKSLALYYFTAGSAEKARTTKYRARPGDGLKRAAIYVDGKALRLYDLLKRRTGVSDSVVSRLLVGIQRAMGRPKP